MFFPPWGSRCLRCGRSPWGRDDMEEEGRRGGEVQARPCRLSVTVVLRHAHLLAGPVAPSAALAIPTSPRRGCRSASGAAPSRRGRCRAVSGRTGPSHQRTHRAGCAPSRCRTVADGVAPDFGRELSWTDRANSLCSTMTHEMPSRWCASVIGGARARRRGTSSCCGSSDVEKSRYALQVAGLRD